MHQNTWVSIQVGQLTSYPVKSDYVASQFKTTLQMQRSQSFEWNSFNFKNYSEVPSSNTQKIM